MEEERPRPRTAYAQSSGSILARVDGVRGWTVKIKKEKNDERDDGVGP